MPGNTHLILVHYIPSSHAQAPPEARARVRRTRSFTDAAAADAFLLSLWRSGSWRLEGREEVLASGGLFERLPGPF